MDEKIKEILPWRLVKEIENLLDKNILLEEIRIRRGRQAYIVLDLKH